MKYKFKVITLLCSILFVTMACIGGDIPNDVPEVSIKQQTWVSVNTKEPESLPAVVTQKPEATSQPTATQEYLPHTYSVETTNVGTCICPVRAGEVEVTLVFKGDNLEMPNFMGESLIFNKVDENRYEYRYITEKSTGPEELMKVITIFDWGYKEEFYTNNSSKLCCVYDYLLVDK